MKSSGRDNSKPWRRASRAWLGRLGVWLLLATSVASAAPRHRKDKMPLDLAEIVSRMSEAGKHLRTLSANLEYTKVTVLVNDKSVESGQLFLHESKSREVLIKIDKPDPKVILFKKSRVEIYIPKINQIQEFDLEQHAELMEGFFTLLGFGKHEEELRKEYKLRFVKEEDLEGDTTAVLELTPRETSTAAHIEKVMLWVSEESWLPVQQMISEPGGDYLIARYTRVKVNREIPASTFGISTGRGTKRVKMN